MASHARFRIFHTALLFRPTVRILLLVLGVWRLTALAVTAFAAPGQAIPFTVCTESTTWIRPTADQQSVIWNDPRYADHGAKAYEWNHEFLVVPVDSASIQYHAANEAGLWTETILSPTKGCEGKHSGDWLAAWILLHRVRSIEADGSFYTITVEPTTRGYQSVVFERVAPKARFRFVDLSGRVLEETSE